MMHPITVDPLKDPIGFLWAELRTGIPLGLGIGVFLYAVFGGAFWHHIIYALCISLTIQFSIEAGRYAMVEWIRRRAPARPEVQACWPGWLPMAPWVLVCAVGGFWIGSRMADVLTGQQHTAQNLAGGIPALGVTLVLTLTVSGLATYFFFMHGKLAAVEAQAEANRRTAAESQLRLLQSQLEPHMLFNTLANLRVLIGVDPERAQAMLDHLIAFLRATLNASRRNAHPLQAEFERIADYLSLIQVRMGSRLSVELDLPAALQALPVPPLLLQPLVENAVLHGLEPHVAGGRLRVRAWQEGATLKLSVEDDGVGLAVRSDDAPAGSGFGLQQVRERLATQYGAEAHLELCAAAPHGCRAQIVLPLPA